MMDEDDKRLLQIFQARRRDRAQLKTRRQKAIDGPLRSVESVIGNLFESNDQVLQKIEESRAILAWEAVVGDCAARVSRALRLRSGQLIVKVSDPLWMAQLTLLKQDLIKKYQTEFPRLGIRDIFFVR